MQRLRRPHGGVDERRKAFWAQTRKRGFGLDLVKNYGKGGTSGNVQHVVSMALDCDGDTLLIQVKPEGPACHTGRTSCFFNEVERS